MRVNVLLVVCACVLAAVTFGAANEVEAGVTSRTSDLGSVTASPTSFRATFWRPADAGGERFGLDVRHEVNTDANGQTKRTFSITSVHATKPRRALLFYATPLHANDVHRLNILDTAVRYPISAMNDLDTRDDETATIEGEAMSDFLETKEAMLLPLMSKEIGSQLGVSAKEHPLSLPMHLLALHVAKLHGISDLDTSPKPAAKAVSAAAPPFWHNVLGCMKSSGMCAKQDSCPSTQCVNDCNTRPLTKWECNNKCEGQCGPGCGCCWEWICGDCCWHQGCWGMQERCDSHPDALFSCWAGKGKLWGGPGFRACGRPNVDKHVSSSSSSSSATASHSASTVADSSDTKKWIKEVDRELRNLKQQQQQHAQAHVSTHATHSNVVSTTTESQHGASATTVRGAATTTTYTVPENVMLPPVSQDQEEVRREGDAHMEVIGKGTKHSELTEIEIRKQEQRTRDAARRQARLSREQQLHVKEHMEEEARHQEEHVHEADMEKKQFMREKTEDLKSHLKDLMNQREAERLEAEVRDSSRQTDDTQTDIERYMHRHEEREAFRKQREEQLRQKQKIQEHIAEHAENTKTEDRLATLKRLEGREESSMIREEEFSKARRTEERAEELKSQESEGVRAVKEQLNQMEEQEHFDKNVEAFSSSVREELSESSVLSNSVKEIKSDLDRKSNGIASAQSQASKSIESTLSNEEKRSEVREQTSKETKAIRDAASSSFATKKLKELKRELKSGFKSVDKEIKSQTKKTDSNAKEIASEWSSKKHAQELKSNLAQAAEEVSTKEAKTAKHISREIRDQDELSDISSHDKWLNEEYNRQFEIMKQNADDVEKKEKEFTSRTDKFFKHHEEWNHKWGIKLEGDVSHAWDKGLASVEDAKERFSHEQEGEESAAKQGISDAENGKWTPGGEGEDVVPPGNLPEVVEEVGNDGEKEIADGEKQIEENEQRVEGNVAAEEIIQDGRISRLEERTEKGLKTEDCSGSSGTPSTPHEEESSSSTPHEEESSSSTPHEEESSSRDTPPATQPPRPTPPPTRTPARGPEKLCKCDGEPHLHTFVGGGGNLMGDGQYLLFADDFAEVTVKVNDFPLTWTGRNPAVSTGIAVKFGNDLLVLKFTGRRMEGLSFTHNGRSVNLASGSFGAARVNVDSSRRFDHNVQATRTHGRNVDFFSPQSSTRVEILLFERVINSVKGWMGVYVKTRNSANGRGMCLGRGVSKIRGNVGALGGGMMTDEDQALLAERQKFTLEGPVKKLQGKALQQAAEQHCARSLGDEYKDCVHDVIATGGVGTGMAQTYAFAAKEEKLDAARFGDKVVVAQAADVQEPTTVSVRAVPDDKAEDNMLQSLVQRQHEEEKAPTTAQVEAEVDQEEPAADRDVTVDVDESDDADDDSSTASDEIEVNLDVGGEADEEAFVTSMVAEDADEGFTELAVEDEDLDKEDDLLDEMIQTSEE